MSMYVIKTHTDLWHIREYRCRRYAHRIFYHEYGIVEGTSVIQLHTVTWPKVYVYYRNVYGLQRGNMVHVRL